MGNKSVADITVDRLYSFKAVVASQHRENTRNSDKIWS